MTSTIISKRQMYTKMAYTISDMIYAQRLKEKAGVGDSDRVFSLFSPRREILSPYNDGEVRFDPSKYEESRFERKTDVDDSSIDSYVRRIILKASLDETESSNPSAQKVKVKPESASPSPKKKDKRTTRRNRKIDRSDTSPEYDVEATPMGTSITLLQSDYRKMVVSELESRARSIHDFYAIQWDRAQRDKMEVYSDALVWKNKFFESERNLKAAEMELLKMRIEYSRIQTELDTIRENKRRRKRDAKQRKSKDRLAGSSASDPGNVDQENLPSPLNLSIEESD